MLHLQFSLGVLSFAEELVFLVSSHLELVVLDVDFLLFYPYLLPLSLLECCVLLHEAQASVGLREAAGAEDEHEFVLYGAVLGHVPHRLDVFLLAFLQLLLQCAHLRLEDADVSIKVLYLLLISVDVLLLGLYLAIEHEKVVEALLHVHLVGPQAVLLIADVLLNLLPLALQSAYLVGGVVGLCGLGGGFGVLCASPPLGALPGLRGGLFGLWCVGLLGLWRGLLGLLGLCSGLLCIGLLRVGLLCGVVPFPRGAMSFPRGGMPRRAMPPLLRLCVLWRGQQDGERQYQ